MGGVGGAWVARGWWFGGWCVPRWARVVVRWVVRTSASPNPTATKRSPGRRMGLARHCAMKRLVAPDSMMVAVVVVVVSRHGAARR